MHTHARTLLLTRPSQTYAHTHTAMALGIQNAMTTKLSGAVIRTTHLTGLTTDLGILTAHWLQG